MMAPNSSAAYGRVKMKNAMKILAMAAGIFATGSEAASNYYKIYGNSCFSATPGLTARITNSGIYNPSSTEAMTVICPITVPDVNYTEGYIGFSGWLRNATDNLSCTLNFSSTDGLGTNSNKATISTSGAFVQYASARVNPAAGNSNAWVHCRIPKTYDATPSYLTRVVLTLTY
jgi:hypothetical protein